LGSEEDDDHFSNNDLDEFLSKNLSEINIKPGGHDSPHHR